MIHDSQLTLVIALLTLTNKDVTDIAVDTLLPEDLIEDYDRSRERLTTRKDLNFNHDVEETKGEL